MTLVPCFLSFPTSASVSQVSYFNVHSMLKRLIHTAIGSILARSAASSDVRSLNYGKLTLSCCNA